MCAISTSLPQRLLWLMRAMLCLLPTGWIVVLRALNGKPLSGEGVIVGFALAVVVLLFALLGEPRLVNGAWKMPMRGVMIALIGATSAAIYTLSMNTIAAWLTVSVLGVACLWLARIFAVQRSMLMKCCVYLALSFACACMISATAQIESHFADEEFFLVGQVLGLWVWQLLVVLAYTCFPRTQNTVQHGLRPQVMWLAIGVSTVACSACIGTVMQYQESFYPATAPVYAGINANQPFLCGEVTPDASEYQGNLVHEQLMNALSANPLRSTAEYGMLALGTDDRRWAVAFRAALLNEVDAQRYTAPANSIKYGQFEAALRVYYYPRVKTAFPDVFSYADDARIRTWFADINRAVYRLDWVDALYALAFSQWPSGAYANQDIGPGLIALLQAGGYAPDDLADRNADFLKKITDTQSGRFRNSDDTFIYQSVWLQNQLFLTPFQRDPSQHTLRESFEWMLLQALPDGSAPDYNHPEAMHMAGIDLLGAVLLRDPRFVWLAGHGLQFAPALYPGAVAGAEVRTGMVGIAPKIGSCLLYGDSGLPNQAGPLGPDKIVMRDGWSPTSAYMLINLRFTGWHRYKATNTITMLYQDGVLLNDDTANAGNTSLPEGRSMLRDKRILRENLNGIVVGKTGMSRVVFEMTGSGTEWAQDPPYYATVNRFETTSEYDLTQTSLQDWRGWSHTRTVITYHDGLIIVHDQAAGSPENPAEVVWNLPQEAVLSETGYALRGGPKLAEMKLLTSRGDSIQVLANPQNPQRRMITVPAEEGKLDTVAVFLLRDWTDATTQIETTNGGSYVAVRKGSRQVNFSLNDPQP